MLQAGPLIVQSRAPSRFLRARRALPTICALIFTCAALYALAQTRANGTLGVAPRLVTRADIGDRLRVFATPGDFALQNSEVTAVVRKRDGALVDFWQNRPRLPTSDQLGTTTNIDGVWMIMPTVFLLDQKAPFVVLASRVATLPDAIESEGFADVNGTRFRAVTQYRLDPKRNILRMTTTFRVEGGAAVGPIGLGDFVKWGNAPYIVEGVRGSRLSYQGPARWVGRHGAGSDLLLRRLDGQPMWLDFVGRTRGFQGNLHVLQHRDPIAAGAAIRFDRELAYERLPVPLTTAPSSVGTLDLEIVDEKNRALPAKVRIDREGHGEPLFEDDGGLDGADRFLWTGSGHVNRTLEPGRYRLLCTSGIERDAARLTIDIREGKTETRRVRLPRVIDTPGVVAADLHLHQAPSVDADISLPARVVAIAAEGVEFAVATDHYVVTDLAPTVSWLEERGLLAHGVQTMPGCEVSTVGLRFGHFNVFPLSPERNVIYEDTTPQALFADARRKSPRGLLQVNHPRMEAKIGYFTFVGLDENTAEPVNRAAWDASFDAIEVYNGDEASDLKKVKKVLSDFLHLIARGKHYAATGNSDSHNLAFLDPGLPRTMIRHGQSSGDSADVEAPATKIVDAIKAGHAYVTSGPIIDASIGGARPGETIRGVGKRARLDVVVRAAPWISLDSVQILLGGNGPPLTVAKLDADARAVVRLHRSFFVPVEQKTFVVVVVEGSRALPNASREGTFPFGFTNPIWIEP